MARGPSTEGPPLSWDRHRAARAVELGAWPAGGVSAAGPQPVRPVTSLPHSAPGLAMPLAAIALLVLGAPLGKGPEPGLRVGWAEGESSARGVGERGPESRPWEADPGVRG